ncbi:hypothetical protein HYH03_011987 [Edaphochlamys debaryana]|uniref:Uncharacterized protein n=1 Tax=Edaphochlamys debaryana TaxID=47281 RepID=A0A836BUG2_9CHLO|nr:hypothetical protein HYH03_011987 [Edaphochlamys debaryana]|eukprot:KAG2489536.1 hypothetical protein HYH03_011987 [Edaphochlamys debaryana]
MGLFSCFTGSIDTRERSKTSGKTRNTVDSAGHGATSPGPDTAVRGRDGNSALHHAPPQLPSPPQPCSPGLGKYACNGPSSTSGPVPTSPFDAPAASLASPIPSRRSDAGAASFLASNRPSPSSATGPRELPSPLYHGPPCPNGPGSYSQYGLPESPGLAFPRVHASPGNSLYGVSPPYAPAGYTAYRPCSSTSRGPEPGTPERNTPPQGARPSPANSRAAKDAEDAALVQFLLARGMTGSVAVIMQRRAASATRGSGSLTAGGAGPERISPPGPSRPSQAKPRRASVAGGGAGGGESKRLSGAGARQRRTSLGEPEPTHVVETAAPLSGPGRASHRYAAYAQGVAMGGGR